MSGDNGNPDLVDWVLNGQPVQSPPGMTILEAAKAHGAELPHFCYHPGLSIAGNCRICLVETNRSPKPAISCSERISPGLEVQTHSPMAVEAREGVMEFQLINHPLDCPVCDKSGECVLQDYSYEHGPDHSRFVEHKNIRHTKDLGPTIKIWGNRCIVCTRCVRFCDEISGTGELCVVARGDRSVVDVFPGIPIDNPLAGNVVDICPVGALISNDFLYQSRVWNFERTDSVCAGCSRGCSVEVQSNAGYVKRLLPRENPQVNQWWMCDYGRYDYRYTAADDRVTTPRAGMEAISAEEAVDRLGQSLLGSGKGGMAIVIDPFLTCEELYLVKQLADRHQADVAGWLPPEGPAHDYPGKFQISAEKCPNRAGAELIFGAEVFGADATRLAKNLSTGKVEICLAFAGFPHGDPQGELVEAVTKARKRIVFTIFDGDWSQGADLVMPSASPFEKEGTYINEDGILQRVRSKDRPGFAHEAQPGLRSAAVGTPWVTPELKTLQEADRSSGHRERVLSSASVFRELAGSVAGFDSLTHREIPDHGAVIPGAGRSQAPARGGNTR